jgi:deazaflavin-dependent oxidoreductase (nitroreductase family)
VKRLVLRAFWRVVNPLARPLAGFAPWWVLVETTGNRTGRLRRTPLAAGPVVGGAMLIIAVHGRHSGWVRNLEATPAVRVRHRGRWRAATASIGGLSPDEVRLFNRYARMGPRFAGIDPLLVRLTFG